MRNKRTILWTVILLILLAALGWGWHLFDRRHQSAAGETADVTINADTLYHQYSTDEHAADQKYMGKVISVTGRLIEIQHSGSSINWLLSTQPGGGGINCQIFAGTKVDPEPRSGDLVTVKGRCTGFLMDVSLVDCVPEK
jgi:hypothetical protein